jgi:ribosomal protein S3
MKKIIRDKTNLCITKCQKYFIENSDIDDFIPREIRDEEIDGRVYLHFNNGTKLFINTANDYSSIVISDELKEFNDLISNFKDVSLNPFWKKRINVKIIEVKELYNLDILYGLKFYLLNGCHFEISYFWETQYDIDTLVIRECTD